MYEYSAVTHSVGGRVVTDRYIFRPKVIDKATVLTADYLSFQFGKEELYLSRDTMAITSVRFRVGYQRKPSNTKRIIYESGSYVYEKVELLMSANDKY